MADITSGMWAKAQRLIAEDCAASYRQANPRKGRKHRSYAVPARAKALVEALGRNDAEGVAAIMLFAQPGDKA